MVGVRVYRCIFFVFVLMYVYVGVDVVMVMMVIRGFVKVLKCLCHHTDIAINSSQYQTEDQKPDMDDQEVTIQTNL